MTNDAEPRKCTSIIRQASASQQSSPATEAAFWLKKARTETSKVVMEPHAVNDLNQRASKERFGFQNILSDAVASNERTALDLAERSAWLRSKVSDGEYIESEDGALEVALAVVRAAKPTDEFRIVHRETRLGCVPMDAALYKPPIDLAFDRNRCSELHAGEVMRVLRIWTAGNPDGNSGWLYGHTGHSVGWVHAKSMTPPMTRHDADHFLNATDRVVATDDSDVMRLGRSAPIIGEDASTWTILWPDTTGLSARIITKSGPLQRGYPVFTRQAVVQMAITQLGQPYGWGGYAGHRDCSRFVMDVFASFGIRLPRFSGYQSKSGVRTVDLRGLSEEQKLQRIEHASKAGVVLLYMQGHIMLYLGFTENKPWAISSISEYRRPCGERKAQTVRLDRIAITDLELGRHTERSAFIERIQTLAVFGT